MMSSRDSQPTYTIINSQVGVINTAGKVNTKNIHCIDSSNEEFELEYFDLPRLITTFKGREEEMQALDSLFFVQKKKKIVICGLPGYGKSELAKNYAIRCSKNENIDKIFWIKSDNKDVLVKSSKTLKKMYKILEEKRCLFIFDNGLTRQDISEYEPPENSKYFLLITSQEKDWGDDVEPVKLKPLSANSAVNVFQSILNSNYKEEDKDLYEKLAHVVGNIPLGLQISGAYIREQIMAFGDDFQLNEYIDLLNESDEDILDVPIPSSSPNTYQKSIYGAVKLSLNKIQTVKDTNKRNLALNILYICSNLYPDPIALDVLLKISHIKKILQGNNLDKKKLIIALRLLDNYSFVTYKHTDSCIIIHRFTQDVVRFHLRKYHPEEHISCYTACLQFAIDNNITDYLLHTWFVLIYADQNISTYYSFYINHPPKDNEKLSRFLYNLILCNSVTWLQNIIESTGDRKKEFITELNLLHIAAEHNRIDIMELLLNYAPNINSKNENLITALHLAAYEWNFDAIRLLILNNADLNVRSADGETALFYFIRGVCEVEYVDMDEVNEIFELFKLEENKYITNDKGRNLLYIAAGLRRHNVELLNLFIQCGLDVNSTDENLATPIFGAAFEWNVAAIKCLINHNADLNSKNHNEEMALFYFMYGANYQENIVIDEVNEIFELLNFEKYKNVTNKNGQNLLYYAVTFCRQNTELLNLLVERGLDVNSTDVDLNTPAHGAASTLNVSALKFLKENHANLNAKNTDGETALFDFIRTTYEHENINWNEVNEVFEIFKLEKNNNNINNKGVDLLYIVSATCCHSKELLNLLLQRGLDINPTYKNQMKPLHVAAVTYNLDAIKFFIKNNADLNARTCEEETALFLFVVKMSRLENINVNEVKEIFELFKFEENKHTTNKLGASLLHIAASCCHQNTDLFNLLLGSGLEVNSADVYQRTPLHIACVEWNVLGMHLLIKNHADLNARDCDGQTALLSYFSGACNRENINLDEVQETMDLLQFEKYRNVTNNNNNTVFTFVASSCHPELVTLLITKYKMNVNHKDLEGDTPIHDVIINFDKLFTHKELEPDIPIHDIITNFDKLVTRKQEDVIRTVETLKSYGARLDIKNKKGKTPLNIAQEKNAEFLFPYLSETDSIKYCERLRTNMRNIFSCIFLRSAK